MMSYLQQFPASYSRTGIYSKSMVVQDGDLRHLEMPHFRLFESVLVNKFEFTLEQAKLFSDFILKMLNIYPEQRPSAFEMMQHPWMKSTLRNYDHIIDDPFEHERAKEMVKNNHHHFKVDPEFHREVKQLEEEAFFADEDHFVEDEENNSD